MMGGSMIPPPSSIDAVRFRWTALAIFAGSVLVLVLYLARYGVAGLGGLLFAASAVFFSKLSIFGGIAQAHFSPWELGFIAWVLDLWIACALLAWIASFARLPLAGRALAEAHVRAGETLREYPGLRRLAFWGIAILVFLPIPGSGAVTGTLVGQLVGLSRMATLVSVGLGAGAAVAVYAAIADSLGEHGKALLENPLVLVLCLIGLVALGWFSWVVVKRELRRS
jgi:uncharacterized membrane protein